MQKVLRIAIAAVALAAGGACSSQAKGEIATTTVFQEPTTIVNPTTTTTVDPLTADVAAIKALYRGIIDASSSYGIAGYAKAQGEAAYSLGGWDVDSVTCAWRKILASQIGAKTQNYDEWVKSFTDERLIPQDVLDPASIDPTPGWVLNGESAEHGGGSVPAGRIYVLTLETLGEKHIAHATVIDGKAYDFPQGCQASPAEPPG